MFQNAISAQSVSLPRSKQGNVPKRDMCSKCEFASKQGNVPKRDMCSKYEFAVKCSRAKVCFKIEIFSGWYTV